MVTNELIESKYCRLIRVLETEASENKSVYGFLSCVKNYELNFISYNAYANREELREFVRGVNRFSDELIFTEKRHSEIKQALYELYDILNS